MLHVRVVATPAPTGGRLHDALNVGPRDSLHVRDARCVSVVALKSEKLLEDELHLLRAEPQGARTVKEPPNGGKVRQPYRGSIARRSALASSSSDLAPGGGGSGSGSDGVGLCERRDLLVQVDAPEVEAPRHGSDEALKHGAATLL
jgi:hypothetical protein